MQTFPLSESAVSFVSHFAEGFIGELLLTKLDAGWAVTCLDPLSCRLSNSVTETFGCQDVSVSYRPRADYSVRMPGFVFNNTTSTDIVPDSSKLHPLFVKLNNGPGSVGVATLASAQVLAQLMVSDVEDTDDEDSDEEPQITVSTSIVPPNSTCKFTLYAQFNRLFSKSPLYS